MTGQIDVVADCTCQTARNPIRKARIPWRRHRLDTDSPDTSINPYVRYARFPRDDPREDVGVGVGVVECGFMPCSADPVTQ